MRLINPRIGAAPVTLILCSHGSKTKTIILKRNRLSNRYNILRADFRS